MRRRIQIQDMNKQVLTLSYWAPFLADDDGEWMPEQPGYVKAGTHKSDNQSWERSQSSKGWKDLFLYSYSGDSRSGQPKMEMVLILRKVRENGSWSFEKSGTGELSKFGAGGVKMDEGTLKWKLL